MRLNTSRAPTTGNAMVVAAPTATRDHFSTRSGRVPCAAASSGATVDSTRRAVEEHDQAEAPRADGRGGKDSLHALPTASGSPKSSEKVCSEYSVLMLRKSAPMPRSVTREKEQ